MSVIIAIIFLIFRMYFRSVEACSTIILSAKLHSKENNLSECSCCWTCKKHEKTQEQKPFTWIALQVVVVMQYIIAVIYQSNHITRRTSVYHKNVRSFFVRKINRLSITKINKR